MNNSRGVLLNLPYAGCVWHWARLVSGQPVVFEAHGLYQRRTQRSRTTILAANGPLDISVPVERNETLPYRDIRINYSTPWHRQHLRALLSAYNSSAYFEYFIDDFQSLYNRAHTFLWDFNIELMHLIAQLLDVKISYQLTQSFTTADDNQTDLRIATEPRFAHLLRGSRAVPYYQLFTNKFGFVPDLSIFDLLFNLGPEAVFTLREMSASVTLPAEK